MHYRLFYDYVSDYLARRDKARQNYLAHRQFW
jgi:hypothetical protein